MQIWQLPRSAACPFNAERTLAQPTLSAKPLSYRAATSGSSRTARTNPDNAFTSVSSALGFDGPDDSKKTQQLRGVVAQAAPTTFYGAEETVTVGEVDYEAGLRNNIQILGNLGRGVEYKVLATNRLANFSVAIQNKSREADWVEVEAWGSLAESASQELGKGARVSVQGRIKQEKWTDPNGQLRTRLKVVANTINKVRNTYQGTQQSDSYGSPAYAQSANSAPGIDQTFQDRSYQHMDQEYVPPPPQQYSYPQAAQTSYSQPSSGSNAMDEKWKVFFQDRTRWWDNRLNKRNPKAPDFKHKDHGDGLWLSSAPQWAQDEVDAPDLGGPVF